MFDLKNKSILITGGSRGLGRALARSLATLGARLVLVARDKRVLGEAVNDIRNTGAVVFGIEADVGDKQNIYPIAGQAAALAGPVDVLINNASTLGPVPLKLLADSDCEDLERVLQVNTIGPLRLIKAVAASMLLRQTGVVVNISSDAAVEAYSGWGLYGVSKAALDHLTRIAASELDSSGVRFFSVDPGEMDTQMHADAMPEADRSALIQPDVVAERIVSMIRHSGQIDNGARVVASDWMVPDETGARASV